MKLEIDLMIAEEVKAGLALLSRVSEAQAEASASVRKVSTEVAPVRIEGPADNSQFIGQIVADFTQRTQVPEGEEFFTAPAVPLPGCYIPDPAQVFGGTPVADPLPSNTIVLAHMPSIVPTMPTPGAASSVAPVELDAKGLPWDSRIHSSSKNKLANGCWKIARGKAPEYVAQVEAELKAGTQATDAGFATGHRAAQVPPTPSFPPVAPVTLVIPDPRPPIALTVPDPRSDIATINGAPIVIPPVVPSFPTVPVVAVPAPPAATVTPTVASSNAETLTFETIMPKISALVTAGKMPTTALMQICTANGLPNVVALQSQPQFIPLVWAALKAQYPELA